MWRGAFSDSDTDSVSCRFVPDPVRGSDRMLPLPLRLPRRGAADLGRLAAPCLAADRTAASLSRSRLRRAAAALQGRRPKMLSIIWDCIAAFSW